MLQVAGFSMKQEDGHRHCTATTRPEPLACSIPAAQCGFIYPSQMTCTQDGSGGNLHNLYCLTSHSILLCGRLLSVQLCPDRLLKTSIHDWLLYLLYGLNRKYRLFSASTRRIPLCLDLNSSAKRGRHRSYPVSLVALALTFPFLLYVRLT